MTERPRSSISKQLLKGLLLPLCSLLLISTMIAYNLAAWFANAAGDQDLLNGAHNIAARLTEDKDGLVAELPSSVQAVLRHNDRDEFFYQVLSLENHRLAGDAVLPLPRSSNASEVHGFRSAVVNGMDVRIARIRVQLPDLKDKVVVVQVARTLNARQELIRNIFLSIVIPQVVLGALTIVLVWLNVGRGLKPLRQLSSDIQKRSQYDLTLMKTADMPSEIVPIVAALNLLFTRLEVYIEAQQRFVANAAHQLRTPVAGLKAYIEYGRRVQADKIKAVLDELDAGTDRISDLVTGLLALARATNGNENSFEPVDLNLLVSEVTSELMREAIYKRIKLTFSPASTEAIVEGDAAELREMITNLVENAIRYTPDRGEVDVALDGGPPVVLNVTDTGPGIPPEERGRVFERFYRVLGTKVDGSGLGLAIVNEIAQTHAATVELSESRTGRGTNACVTFAP